MNAVYIPLPNHLHVDWTLRAIAAGKHVLCEKPMALTPADVERVAAAAADRGVVVAEAFMYRHHPLTCRVAEMVREGASAALRALRGAFTFSLTRANDVRLVPGVGRRQPVGRRLLSGQLRAPAGRRAVAVTAPGGAARERHRHGRSPARCCFDGDVVGVFDCGFGAHFRTFVEMAGTDGVIALETPFKPGRRARCC